MKALEESWEALSSFKAQKRKEMMVNGNGIHIYIFKSCVTRDVRI